MSVLVTGGAGYIGSHVVRRLVGRGERVVIADDFVTGVRDRVAGIPLIEANLATADAVEVLEAIIEAHSVDAVIHFAARKQVGESAERPAWYYQQNIGSLANVLLAMERQSVKTIVFSSSAAVYGSSNGESLSETTPTRPTNPYGETKLIGEWLLADAVVANDLRAASLRYFNVAGAGWPELADTAVLNLVPMVFEKLDQGMPPEIFGNDYPTEDGTCIRDFIHVLDLADAHLATLDYLRSGNSRHDVFNVGTGTGSSVLEMVNSILRIAGSELTPRISNRRPGDPAAVVADPTRMREIVGWRSRLGLEDIVTSAWGAHVKHSDGQHIA